jgi:DNA-binding CsgD family transcriptional regulator
MGTVTPEDGRVPEPVSRAVQKRAAREAGRRRQAADELRIAASLAMYAAEQIGNGLTPEAARAAVMDAAGELAAVSVSLRRLARLSARERAALAGHLAALGMSDPQIAARLGVSIHTVWGYRHGLRGDGQPWR